MAMTTWPPFGPVDPAWTSRVCPCCVVRGVFMHVLQHEEEIVRGAGERLCYRLVQNGHETVRVDLGVLSIQMWLESHYAVHVFGEVVMTITKTEIDLILPGPWMQVLCDMRNMLDDHFGSLAGALAHARRRRGPGGRTP